MKIIKQLCACLNIPLEKRSSCPGRNAQRQKNPRSSGQYVPWVVRTYWAVRTQYWTVRLLPLRQYGSECEVDTNIQLAMRLIRLVQKNVKVLTFILPNRVIESQELMCLKLWRQSHRYLLSQLRSQSCRQIFSRLLGSLTQENYTVVLYTAATNIIFVFACRVHYHLAFSDDPTAN